MKSDIILLNVMRYVKKKDGKETPMSRVQFVFTHSQKSENYVGTEPITCYFKGHDVYKKLCDMELLQCYEADFKEIKDYYNPLATKQLLKSIDGISLE